jgi:hypothetical protein
VTTPTDSSERARTSADHQHLHGKPALTRSMGPWGVNGSGSRKLKRSGSDGGSGLYRVGWSRVAWFQAPGGGVRSSYSTGLKSAVDSSSRVLQSLRLSSSTWTRAQKDSIIALSTQSPMEPIEGSRPMALARWVNARDPK